MTLEYQEEEVLAGGGRSRVTRQGQVVYRDVFPWTPSVHAVLRHLESKDFDASPRVFEQNDHGKRDALSYIEGETANSEPWTDAQIESVATLLRRYHEAMSDFVVPEGAIWRKWFARDLAGPRPLIGHCDFAPWNIVTRKGVPCAVIDWETVGPVSALVEVAHACWLNVQLVDDDVAERAGLPSVDVRLKQLRLFADVYGVPKDERALLLDRMIKVAILDAADQAIDANIKFNTTDITPLWGLAWRSRSAAWMVRHADKIQGCLIY